MRENDRRGCARHERIPLIAVTEAVVS
jgi:hypothetical protein